MTRDEALRLKVGDTVMIKPLWNRTEGRARQIDRSGVKIEAIHDGVPSQTGIMLTISTVGDGTEWLDAGWFDLPPPTLGDLFKRVIRRMPKL